MDSVSDGKPTELSEKLHVFHLQQPSPPTTSTSGLSTDFDDDDSHAFSDADTEIDIATSVTDSARPLDEDGADAALKVAQDMLSRCRILLRELEQFGKELEKQGKETTVESRTFGNELKAEGKYLKKLCETNPTTEKIHHNISSSNLPYYEALWNAAKRSSELCGFRRWFYWGEAVDRVQGKASKNAVENPIKASKQKKNNALVDVIAEKGRSWIKVSTVTDKRLLYDLARQGWYNADDSDDEGIEADDKKLRFSDYDSEDEDAIPLLKIAHDLVKAAAINRVRNLPPKITLVLTRVHAGIVKEVDVLLDGIRSLGVDVQCADDIGPAPPLYSVLPRLVVDDFKEFSDVLNIDCTILLALVSDISHTTVELQPWFPRAVRQQIEVEKKEHLLPESVYPAMGGRELVCTSEAVQRMREIVATIGTDTEKSRTVLLLGDDPALSTADLIAGFQELSDHPVPNSWRIPIRVVGFSSSEAVNKLPSVARQVAESLSDINTSVFLYGWTSGRTTLSSNATAARQIEKIIVDQGDSGVSGPLVWLCSESRSLVAKKGRGDAE